MPLLELQPTSLNGDVPASETGPDDWTGGQNVQFRNGFAVRSNGWSKIFPQPNYKPQWLLNATYQGTNYWINCGADGIEITNTAIWIDITPAGWTVPDEPNQYTGGILNGIPIINLGNQQNVPWYLRWSDLTLQPLPDWPADTTCSAMRTFKYHIIAMNLVEDSVEVPDKIIWSSAAGAGSVPSSWTPLPENDAGSNILSATRSPIIDGHTLRGNFYIYKAASVYTMTFVGGTFVFAFRKLFSSVGMLARNCGIEYEGSAYVLSDGSFLIHDGQNINDIGTKRIQNFVFSQLDPVAWKYSFLVLDKPNNEVLFCLAPQNEPVPSVAAVFSTNSGSWGYREIGSCNHIANGVVTVDGYDDSWDANTDSWAETDLIWNRARFSAADDGLLMASEADTDIYQLDGDNTQNGDPVNFGVTKIEMDFGEPDTYKLVKKVWPHVTAQGAVMLQVRVGGSPAQGAAVTWAAPVLYNPDTEAWIDTFASGRYIAIEVSSSGGQKFQLNKLDIEADLQGRY